MQRVGTLKSQHNLILDCYNKYIREKRRFQNMTNIKTVKTQAFGRELHYVLDPVYAAALTSLTGKKTINAKDIANLETLGIAVNLKPETQLAFAGV
jgi:hypothetical protein